MIELKIRFVDTGDGTVYKPITLAELCQRIEIPRRIVLESENGDFIDTDDFLDQFEKGELIIEPYTGLKDKNGKEVYEGDIVEYTTCYYGNEKRHRKVVEREEWDSDDFGQPHNIGYFNLSEYMEVIGNIHENPELLEEK